MAFLAKRHRVKTAWQGKYAWLRGLKEDKNQF